MQLLWMSGSYESLLVLVHHDTAQTESSDSSDFLMTTFLYFWILQILVMGSATVNSLNRYFNTLIETSLSRCSFGFPTMRPMFIFLVLKTPPPLSSSLQKRAVEFKNFSEDNLHFYRTCQWSFGLANL